MTEPSTPLMRQYAAIKKEHPNALLFFRLGDFYELFFEDAVVAAKELQITLTSRNKEKGIAIPMCGVPYHAAENYISKLIRKGFKVAICDQMEDPRVAKKIVKREVTRVVTPGTAADSQLQSEENNFLACVAKQRDEVGFAALDLSTGEFRATEFRGADAERRVRDELLVLRPREVLFASSLPLFDQPSAHINVQKMDPTSRGCGPPASCGRAAHGVDRECELGGDSAGRLGVRAGLRDSAGREPFRRAVAGRLWPGEPFGGGDGGGSDPALRAHHAARLARSHRPHRLLRAAELPGARCGDGAQPGADRAAVLRRGRQRHAVSLPRLHGDADGQAAAALVDSAAVDRAERDRAAAERGRSDGRAT